MKFIRINSNDEYFNKAMEIYKVSFPIFEQRTMKDQIEALQDKDYHFDVIYDEDKMVGILLYWDMNEYKYIEHFAIDSSLRGKNYGSRVLKEFCKHNKNVILEIDPPIDEVSIKRLNFYLKLGFKLQDFNHVHPSYRKECKSHSLKIMTFNEDISKEDYDTFNKLLKKNVMKYSEVKDRLKF
ncbi:GNAT family N-acetyltransferase [Clostridium perfringens]|nr:GNAT family N-acetyltransferase [Clostridium perfringens]